MTQLLLLLHIYGMEAIVLLAVFIHACIHTGMAAMHMWNWPSNCQLGGLHLEKEGISVETVQIVHGHPFLTTAN